MIKLYGIGKTRWNRPYWLLQELDLPFQSMIVDPRIDEHRTPEFLTLNPHGKLPVLVDRDRVVTESVAICLYLAEEYGQDRFLPTEAVERAQMFRWLFFCVGELEGPLQRMDLHLYHYPEEKKHPPEVQSARADYQRAAAVLEQHLRGRDFLVGDTLTVADVTMGYVLVWAGWESLLDDYPETVRYLEQLKTRPAFPDALKSRPLAD